MFIYIYIIVGAFCNSTFSVLPSRSASHTTTGKQHTTQNTAKHWSLENKRSLIHCKIKKSPKISFNFLVLDYFEILIKLDMLHNTQDLSTLQNISSFHTKCKHNWRQLQEQKLTNTSEFTSRTFIDMHKTSQKLLKMSVEN